MTDGKVANQQSLQVTDMKENLNEYKFIIACCDSVLNTSDPIKTAVAHAGLYTSLYAILLLCNVSKKIQKIKISTKYPKKNTDFRCSKNRTSPVFISM